MLTPLILLLKIPEPIPTAGRAAPDEFNRAYDCYLSGDPSTVGCEVALDMKNFLESWARAGLVFT